jgi:hypothetical protein
LLKRFEDFLARNSPANGKQRVFAFATNDSYLVPRLPLGPFHSNQNEATVAFRQNVNDVPLVNTGFLSGPGRYHHLSATVDCCMHELKHDVSNAYTQATCRNFNEQLACFVGIKKAAQERRTPK